MAEIRDVGVALEAPDSSDEAIDRLGLLRLMLTLVFCGVFRSNFRRDEGTSAVGTLLSVRVDNIDSVSMPWRLGSGVAKFVTTFGFRTGDGSPLCKRSKTALLSNAGGDCDETLFELESRMRDGDDAFDGRCCLTDRTDRFFVSSCSGMTLFKLVFFRSAFRDLAATLDDKEPGPVDLGAFR